MFGTSKNFAFCLGAMAFLIAGCGVKNDPTPFITQAMLDAEENALEAPVVKPEEKVVPTPTPAPAPKPKRKGTKQR